jgi:hypothetical protein
MTGASKFPRHWLYDADGTLTHKSGLTDFSDWRAASFSRHTPWGDQDSEALVTAVETALEHSLSAQLMHGVAKPRTEQLPAGHVLVHQGEPGTDIYLILDGVVRVERGGEWLAEYGSGALLGKRAHLEEGAGTSTLVTVTPCRVASVDAGQLDRSSLVELSGGTGAKTPPGPEVRAYTCAVSTARPPRPDSLGGCWHGTESRDYRRWDRWACRCRRPGPQGLGR